VSGSWNAWYWSSLSRSRNAATVLSRWRVRLRFSTIVSTCRATSSRATRLPIKARNGPNDAPVAERVMNTTMPGTIGR
jgi:hypothetical protein